MVSGTSSVIQCYVLMYAQVYSWRQYTTQVSYAIRRDPVLFKVVFIVL